MKRGDIISNLKAVFYCRVSTDEESQLNSLQSQIEECTLYINNNRWKLIDSYIDEGKSGTQTKKRDEYKRLLNDIEYDKFDIIVIKSQDRLMRNVKDWYIFIDKLVTYKKQLFFYLENKFYTPDDVLITGIKAILAEEYSRDLSKKLNKAHRNRQKNGSSVIITSATWGYYKKDKKVMVNESEAKIVCLIYELCIQGYGSRTISKELSNRGILSRTGKEFPEVTIRRIIRNPLFKGTAVMNKTHRDFNTKQTFHNPESEWIYHENVVPAIVSHEIWEKANEMMDANSKEVHTDDFKKKRIGVNKGKFDLSSKIICGECGSIYWRRYRKLKDGTQVIEWSCSEYVKRGRKNIIDSRGEKLTRVLTENSGCDNIHIKEKKLNKILISGCKEKFYTKDVSNKLIELISNAYLIDVDNQNVDKIKSELNKIEYKRNFLLDRLIDGIISDEQYKQKIFELDIIRLRLIKEQEILEKQKSSMINPNKISIIEKEIRSISESIGIYEIICEHVEKITVYHNYIAVKLDVVDKVFDLFI